MTRVVITGMGILSPIGNNIKDFEIAINNQKVGFTPLPCLISNATGITLAGRLTNFNPLKYFTKKEIRRMDIFTQYAMYTTEQSMRQAGLTSLNTNSERFGVIWGSGLGGLTTTQKQVIRGYNEGFNYISPMFIPTSIINMAAANISIKYHLNGISTTIVTACASSANAIGEAFRQIKYGNADVMIAGGSESSINEVGISGFAAISTLSKAVDPQRASIPFDINHNGFVMGEGAGTLVLESLEHAQNRGAKILGEIVGYGYSSDAYHITSPDPVGTQVIRAMNLAISEAKIAPQQVGYINAHGTSTKANDIAEARAIKYVFRRNNKVLVSSTKSMTGHLLGAAGAVETIATILSLNSGKLPVNVGTRNQDPECPIKLVTERNCKQAVKYAISNSFGFGGHNVVLALKKWDAK